MTMNNPGDRDNYRSENRQESYTDANGETRTHVQRTSETVHNTSSPSAYGSGYISGRDSERRYQQANLAERDNTNTANGLLIGVILTSLVTLGAAALWYFNQRNNPAVDNTSPVVVPVPVPNSASPSPAASQSPPSRTTIIERTREVPVVIPQQQAPASSAPAPVQPNINITVPSQRPGAEKAPTTSPSTSNQKSSTNQSSAQDNKSDSLTTTPLSGADKSNTNSNDSSSLKKSNSSGSAQ